MAGRICAHCLFASAARIFTVTTDSNKTFDSTGNQRPDYAAPQHQSGRAEPQCSATPLPGLLPPLARKQSQPMRCVNE